MELEGGLGVRFHVKERLAIVQGSTQSVWEYEERQISLQPTSMLLVRIMIGKVLRPERLRSILAHTPIRAGYPGYESWNCVEWLKEALALLEIDGRVLGTSETDWDYVRDTTMWYIGRKLLERRFDGTTAHDQTKAATWDLLQKNEIIP